VDTYSHTPADAVSDPRFRCTWPIYILWTGFLLLSQAWSKFSVQVVLREYQFC